MTFEIVELVREDGISLFKQWFDALDGVTAVRITIAVLRMSDGNLSSIKWFKGIGEYKLDFGPGYSVYMAKDGERLILLLGGGTKRRQQKDIETALNDLANYKRAKRSKE
jgi:putative addiction module killer protein